MDGTSKSASTMMGHPVVRQELKVKARRGMGWMKENFFCDFWARGFKGGERKRRNPQIPELPSLSICRCCRCSRRFRARSIRPFVISADSTSLLFGTSVRSIGIPKDLQFLSFWNYHEGKESIPLEQFKFTNLKFGGVVPTLFILGILLSYRSEDGRCRDDERLNSGITGWFMLMSRPAKRDLGHVNEIKGQWHGSHITYVEALPHAYVQSWEKVLVRGCEKFLPALA